MTRPNNPGLMAYRPDIDGLRALAVIPVLMFHIFPKFMPGGYIGVDIFFVISGYLITSILLSEVAQNKFSVIRFYIRRARRLFPALFVVLLAVIAFGWVAMLPNEFSLLGKHIFAGATFISNIVLWRETGYFDASSEHKPLLHLWSLGVEEQYYVLWPLLVLLLARRSNLFLPIAVLLTLCSFALNVTYIHRPDGAVFYLPVSRFWELLIGGILAFIARQRHSAGHFSSVSSPSPLTTVLTAWQLQMLSVVGVGVILIALFKFDKNTVFPGWAALLPVLGSAAVIAAGPNAIINRLVLSSPPAVWIGLISYPLYLWHWPLIAYAHLVLGNSITISVNVGIFITAIGLAWLTYRFVEKPITAPRRSNYAGRDAIGLWIFIGCLGLVGVTAWCNWFQPRSAYSISAQNISKAQSDWKTISNGTIEGDRPEQILFMGDSIMEQYLPRIEKVATERIAPVYTVQIKTKGGCAPLRGVERKSIHCSQFVNEAYALARDPTVKIVIIAASWWGFSNRDDYYSLNSLSNTPIQPYADENRWIFENWAEELTQLVHSGKRVILLTSSPMGPLVDPMQLVNRSALSWQALPVKPPDRSQLKLRVEKFDDRIRDVALRAGAEILDPFDWLCDAHRCPILNASGEPIFKDDSHLRATYVREQLSMLDNFIYIDRQSPLFPTDRASPDKVDIK